MVVGPLGGAQTMRVWAPMNRISISIERPQRAPWPFLTREDTMRSWPSMNQEASSYQTRNLLVPWSWNSQPPELWEMNVFCFFFLICLSMVFLLQQHEQTKTLYHPFKDWILYKVHYCSYQRGNKCKKNTKEIKPQITLFLDKVHMVNILLFEFWFWCVYAWFCSKIRSCYIYFSTVNIL